MDHLDPARLASALLEDATARLPSKKAEIRILPARGLDQHHDVILISDLAPVYIGTIAPKHSVWRVIKTANNVGRKMRTMLHWHMPTKEECAIRMAEVMRPYWKPVIERHGLEESELIDPKETVCTSAAMAAFYRQRMLDIDAELARLRAIVDRDHNGQPDAREKAEIIDLVSEYRVLQRRLGESEIDPKETALSLPISFRLGYVYHWDDGSEGAMEKDRYQEIWTFPTLREAYDHAIKQNYPSRYETFIEVFYGDYAEGKSLARTFRINQEGELIDEDTGEPVEIDESIDPKEFVNQAFGPLRTLRDLQKYDNEQAFWCNDPVLMKDYDLNEPFKIWGVHWLGGGVVCGEFYHPDFSYPRSAICPITNIRPVIMESTKAEIDAEAEKAEKPTSPEQAEAGNYKKGHVSVQGLEIAIENAKGSTRSGTNKQGEAWSVTMPAHYGYIKGTVGKDKDHLDVYIGDNPGGMLAFVVNQRKEEGGFDEHKIMLGFSSKDEAIAAYDRAFTGDLGPKLRETVVSTTVDKLKEWLSSGKTKKPFESIAEALVDSLLENDDIDPKDLASEIELPPNGKFSAYDAHANLVCDLVTGDVLEVDGALDGQIDYENIRAVDIYRYRKTSRHGSRENDQIPLVLLGFWMKDGSYVPPSITLEESVDPKDFMQQNVAPLPRFYGDLKIGMVTYDETGAYNRVEKFDVGYGADFQDQNGKLVHDSGPSRVVCMKQFSPAYAYGRFTHVYRHNVNGALLDEQVVHVKDNSDEALWALVDAEIDKHRGPGAAAAAREAHLERERQPEAVARRAAHAEIQRMMGGGR